MPGHPDEAEAQLRAAARGDDPVYVRLSNQSDARPLAPDGGPGFRVLRRGGAATVLAVGPLADTALAATEGLDVTVPYAATVRPFDAATLRAALTDQADADVVLAEPYLAGTSAGEVAEALGDRPHRLLSLGVARDEARGYGTPRRHAVAHDLGSADMRLHISRFLRS
ncbi:transketolase C-terminal domain-containing protein [Streptomyces brasiliensis]|uniref:Transketolase C-terminal domain-containing protein n=1 Tax=Streptomyces brasiliensis TaxID=1954 RepID=A0A917KX06_9ACTN|nr:hypothetical protein GCM10010121_051900 [Streptomyces brasiliensis]